MQHRENKDVLRALVVEGDSSTRRLLSESLSGRGFEVNACETPQQAREHYHTQSLVLAGTSGNNGDVQRLVDFIRRSSGARQPYIITMAEEGSGVLFPGPGVNDLLYVPIDERTLALKIGAARAWLAGRVVDEHELEVALDAEKSAAAEPEAEPAPAPEPEVEAEEELEFALDDDDDVFREPEEVEAAPESDAEAPVFEAAPEPEPAPAPEPEKPKPAPRPAAKPAVGTTTRFHLVELVENGPLPTAMFDKSMHYLAANSRWIRAYGLENDEVIGTSHFEFFSEVSQLWQDLCRKCVEEDREQIGEESVVWADGGRERVHWIMRPWHYEAHEVGGLVVSYYPLPEALGATVPKAATPVAPLTDEESEFATDFAAALAQSQTAPVLVLDLQGRIMRSNRLARKLGRWSQTHGDERYYWQVFLDRDARPATQQRFIEFACDVVERGGFAFPPTTLDSVPCADGTLRRIVWHNLPRHGADGKINGMIRVGVDMEELAGAGVEVGEIPASEPARAATRGRAAAPEPAAIRDVPTFDDWLHGLPGLHWKARRDGKIIFFNRAWLEFRGRRIEEEIDNGWMDGLHEEDHKRLVDAFLEIAETGGRMNQLARVQSRGGDARWLRFIIPQGRYGNAENSDVFIGYCEDMTAQKHLEEELAKLQEAVEESTRRNHSELEQVSGELRAAIEGAHSERDALREEKGTLEEELAALRAKFGTLQSEYDAILGESARAVEKLHFHEERATKLELNLKDARHEVVRMHEVAAKITDERNRFATIPDNAPFGILVFGSDGKLRYTNPAHATVAGSLIDAEEGMDAWLRKVCPDTTDEAREALVNQWRENVWRGQRTTVLSVASDDDTLRDLEFRPRMMKDGQFLVSIFDVSDRQRDENRVRANEAKFRALFHDSGVGMALIDRSGAIVDLNAALESLVGKNRGEILKGGIEGLIVEEDRVRRDALLEELRESQARSGNVDLRVLGAGGQALKAQMNVSLIKDARGEVLYTAYFLHPFPDFPEPEPRAVPEEPAPAPAPGPEPPVVDEEARLRSLAFAGLHDAVVVADLKGRIIEWNHGAARIFGYEKEEILGKSLYVLYEREDPHRFRDKITRSIGGQRKWEETTPIFRKDGSQGFCEVVYVPVTDDDGTPVALAGVNREVSGPRPAAEAGGIVDERLVRALGCHLETIADLLDLQAGVLEEPAARRAVVAGQNRVRALTLLQSGVTAGGGEVDFGSYVKALVQHLLEEIGPEHAELKVHLNVRNISLPLEVAAPLALCLNELLSNAFAHAFTGRSTGLVSVNMALTEEGGWMTVKDDGVGLPPTLDVEDSSGLGLRVTRDLARKLGSDVRKGEGPGTEIQIGFRANPD